MFLLLILLSLIPVQVELTTSYVPPRPDDYRLKLSVLRKDTPYHSVSPSGIPMCRQREIPVNGIQFPTYINIFQPDPSYSTNTGLAITFVNIKMQFMRGWGLSCYNSTLEKTLYNKDDLSKEEQIMWWKIKNELANILKGPDRQLYYLLNDYSEPCPYWVTSDHDIRGVEIRKIPMSWDLSWGMVDPVRNASCKMGSLCRVSDSDFTYSSHNNRVNSGTCRLIPLTSHSAMIYPLQDKSFHIMTYPEFFSSTIDRESANNPVCRDKVYGPIYLTSSGVLLAFEIQSDRHPFCEYVYGMKMDDPICLKRLYQGAVIRRKTREMTGDLEIVPIAQKSNWIYEHSLVSERLLIEGRNKMINFTITDMINLEYAICQQKRASLEISVAIFPLNPRPYLFISTGSMGFRYMQSKGKTIVAFGTPYILVLDSIRVNMTNPFRLKEEWCRILDDLGTTYCAEDRDELPDETGNLIPLLEGGSYDVKRKEAVILSTGIKLHTLEMISIQFSTKVEACWAHNPEVRGSKPRSATNCGAREW